MSGLSTSAAYTENCPTCGAPVRRVCVHCYNCVDECCTCDDPTMRPDPKPRCTVDVREL